VLVAITAEIIYRSGGDDEFFNTPEARVITGVGIGLVGATAWEGVEIVLDMMGFPISRAILDTFFDIFLGVVGGAIARGRRPFSRPALQALTHQRQSPQGPLDNKRTEL
jgi:hypothetical protein